MTSSECLKRVFIDTSLIATAATSRLNVLSDSYIYYCRQRKEQKRLFYVSVFTGRNAWMFSLMSDFLGCFCLNSITFGQANTQFSILKFQIVPGDFLFWQWLLFKSQTLGQISYFIPKLLWLWLIISSSQLAPQVHCVSQADMTQGKLICYSYIMVGYLITVRFNLTP